jgi:secreted PhoX family phosphatase
MTTQADSAKTGLSRRSFIGGGAAATLGIALSGTLGPIARASGADHGSTNGAKGGFDGYGPLQPDPAGLLALPNGFHYTVLAASGATLLDSGEVTPGNPDGAASFVRPGGDGVILVTNHEIRPTTAPPWVPHLEEYTYDPGPSCGGGTTTIEVDKHNDRVREYVSLAGTTTNCAGGKTPWNTWLTCEEAYTSPPTVGYTKPHGFVFEVDPYDVEANRFPEPIAALGRFEHEAVAVDPDTGQIYETEDATNPHGLFYRWTPPPSLLPLGKGSLRGLAADAGALEAMRARDGSGAIVPDLSVAIEPGTTYSVEWVAVTTRVPVGNAASRAVRRQFNFPGGPVQTPGRDVTRSQKLEGAWWGDGGAYFVASFARTANASAVAHDGQVWFLDPLAQTITLKLRFAYTPDSDDDPEGPDNICVSPYGGVLLAEDGTGVNHVIGVTEDGHTYFLAENQLPGSSEFAGVNFSPDKQTLFVNLFLPGHVYAITGPWKRQGGGGQPVDG